MKFRVLKCEDKFYPQYFEEETKEWKPCVIEKSTDDYGTTSLEVVGYTREEDAVRIACASLQGDVTKEGDIPELDEHRLFELYKISLSPMIREEVMRVEIAERAFEEAELALRVFNKMNKDR